MKNSRKLISVILTAVMILTAFPLTALQAFAEVDYTDIALGDTVQIELTSNNPIKYLRFIPQTSGTYYFKSFDNIDNADPKGYVYDESLSELSSNDDTDGRNFLVECFLEAGTTYYLGCSTYNGNVAGAYSILLTDNLPVTDVIINEGDQISGLAGSEKQLTADYRPTVANEPQYVWESSDTSVATVDSTGLVSFIATGTATITLSVQGNSSISTICIVNVVAHTALQLNVPTTADITGGGSLAYYSFTPTESGTYTFESLSDSDTYGHLYDDEMNEITRNDDDGEDSNFKITYQLDANTTYIFGARYYSTSETGSFNVVLKKAVSASSIEFAEGSSYSGIAYETKTFNVTLLPEGCVEESCSFYSDDEDVAIISYYGSNECEVRLLAPGTATLKAESESGLTATCDITVSAADAMTLNTPYTFSLTGNPRLATFTPTEDGTYFFNFSDYEADYSFAKVLYSDFYHYADTYTDSFSCDLYADNTYVLQLPDYTGPITATVVKAVPATGIEFITEPGISEYTGASVQLNARLVPGNALDEDVTFTSSNDNIASVYNYGSDNNTKYCYVNLNAVGTATITASTESGLSATYTLVVKPYPQLTLDVPFEFEENDSDDVAVFTPSQDGVYAFEFSDFSDYTGFQINLYEDTTYCTYTYSNKLSYNMQAGHTYRISTSYPGSFKVTVSRMVPATSMVFTTEPGFTDFPYTNTELTLKLLPANAIYEEVTFTSSNDNIVSVENSYYDQNNDETVCGINLNAPGTAVITATSENGLTATYTVVVKSMPTLTLNTATRVTITNNEEQTFVFTPSQSGTYYFAVSNSSPVYNLVHLSCRTGGSYYNEFESEDSEPMAAQLESGVTYVIDTYFNEYRDPGNGSFDLTVYKATPATAISFAEGSTYSGYENTLKILSLDFTPVYHTPESVRFTSGNENIVKVMGGSNEECQIKLVAPGTATVTATSENGLTATCTVTVKELKTLTLGVTAAAEIINGGDEDYFRFTPTQTGVYTFSSQADYDTYGELFDADMNLIAHDDDSGTDNNFRIRQELQAGVTYMFGARYYNSSNTGSFPVIIEDKAYATDIEIVQMPDQTEYIKGHFAFDATGLRVKITWSDGRTTYYSYGIDEAIIEGCSLNVSSYTSGENSAYFTVVYDGCSASAGLTLIESPVESIELAYASSLTLVENYNGHYSKRYDDNGNVLGEYFYYNYYSSLGDIPIIVHFKDGTSVMSDINSPVNGIRFERYDTQSINSPWTVGGNNYITVSYVDQSVNLPVIIVPNDVTSLELVTAPSKQFVENVDGYTSSRWDYTTGNYVDFFCYDFYTEDLKDGVVKINYRDGSSRTAHIGDEIGDDYVGITSYQQNEPWSLGTNYAYVTFAGARVQVPIQVVETPASRIVINTAPSAEYIFGSEDYGHIETIRGTDYYRFYPGNLNGLVFTVYYKNGTSKQFTSADIDNFNGYIDGHPYTVEAVNGDNENYYTGPCTANVTFSYLGVSATYSATLKASPVSNIQIVQQPAVASRRSCFAVDPNGMKVQINYKNGTSKTVTFTDAATEYSFANNTSASIMVDGYPLSVGLYTGIVSYMGVTTTIPATVTDTDYDSIDVDIVSFSSNADGMVIDVAWEDGTAERLTFTTLQSITPGWFFGDDNYKIYVTRTSRGLVIVEIGTVYDDNDQIESYYVMAIKEMTYVPNTVTTLGDVDLDGGVDIADYAMLKSYLGGSALTETKLNAGDINGDGTIDAFDLFYLDKIINGIAESKYTYTALNDSTAKITAYSGTDNYLTVPEYLGGYQITAIDNNVFKAKTSLVDVDLPDSVTSIGQYSFMNCTKLESISLPYGLKTIGYGAFNGCTNLTSLKLPNTVTTLGTNSFKGCTSLKSVSLSNSMTAIGNSVFANCTSLESVIIPSSIKTINANAFSGCTSLTTIYGTAGSYAQTFANANGYTFVAI